MEIVSRYDPILICPSMHDARDDEQFPPSHFLTTFLNHLLISIGLKCIK